MSTNRELLDLLGRDTLVRLMRERTLAPTRENDERRKALAHSYHGDVEQLILDLSRQELLEVFKNCTFDVRGVESCVSNPGKYRHDELQAFAIRAFAGRRVRIPADFTPVEVDDDGEAEDVDFDEDEDEDEDEDDGVESAEAGDDDADEISVAEALGIESSSWSRPRMIERILHALGHEPVQRLRASRFQDIITELSEGGVEACLADDPAERILTSSDDSPGIDTKLRLRLRETGGHGTHAPTRPRGPVAASSTSLAADGGPRIVVQPGEAPIRAQVVKPSQYNLADLRLRFLTSVRTAGRRTLPAWPDEYLRAATRGLSLTTPEHARLRAFSASLCFGSDDLDDTILRLGQSLSPSECETLLEDFKALNPFHPELVETIVQQVEPITVPRSTAQVWRSAEPIPADLVQPQSEAPATEPRAASSANPGPPAAATEAESANQRDLGALAAMFDED